MNTHETPCGYVGCDETAVAQIRQLVGRRQVLPVCRGHKDQLLEAWANIPASLAHLPIAQVMEPLTGEPLAKRRE